jgi:hypothetical protein
MTKQIINVGSGELSGDGESLRSAFVKTNSNFNEVYTAIDAIPTNISAFNNDVGYITTSTPSHPANSINSGTTSLTVTNDGNLTLSANSLFTAFNSDLNIQVANTANSINIYGEFHVHAPDILGITSEPLFRVKRDGQIRVLVPKQDLYEGGVNIVGSTGSNFLPPVNLGVMLQVTGQLNQPSRIYNDGNGTFSAYVGRRYNGIVANPQPMAKDDVIMRISAAGYASNGMPSFGSSRIVFNATEAYTTSSQGGELQFWTNATGTNFLAKDITINSHGITFRDGTSQDTAAIPMSYRAAANGVATLDSNGKVPLNQLAAGAVIYKGAWNADTNQTAVGGYALSDTTPVGLVSGWQYSVSETGTVDIGNGTDTFVAGDYVTFNGTRWDRIPGALSSVSSFNGRIGAITMTTTDVTNVLTPGSIPTDRLVVNSYTFNQGAGISVTNNGSASALGSSITIRNIGVTSIIAGTNITVSANTGSVTIGTSIPIGYTGSRGTDGVVGYNGSVGYTGSKGNTGTGYTGSIGGTGYTGSAGANGFVGSQGVQGINGYTGSAGTNGTNGTNGYTGSAGVQGTNGFTGSQGTTGTTGATGYTGSQGTQGSIGGTGYTGSLGGLGYTGSQGIGYTGSASTASGYAGSIGYTGSRGSDGTNGANGATGYTGSQGNTGTTGATGYTGSIGGQGQTGATGYTGSKGDAGTNGFTGFTGSQGTQGVTGATGYTGSLGITGYTGSAGTNGTTGYTGSAGTQGNQGTTGYTGSAGTNGTNGTNGATGYTGSAGTNGTNGYTGSAGTNGTTGFTGSRGLQGYDGSQGIQGLTGNTGYTGSLGSTGYTGSQGVGYTGSKGVADVYVSSISTGTGISVTTSTGAVTVSLNTATVMSQAVNLSAMSSILAGTVVSDAGNIAKGSSVVTTASIVGLTTNHHIMMLPNSGMVDGVLVGGATCLSNGVVSITFQNPTSAAINPPSYTIAYIAWI